tara:strand:- start:533 stop:697 length:165 start_codon:yes stop_codon:yes gene_type:complete
LANILSALNSLWRQLTCIFTCLKKKNMYLSVLLNGIIQTLNNEGKIGKYTYFKK